MVREGFEMDWFDMWSSTDPVGDARKEKQRIEEMVDGKEKEEKKKSLNKTVQEFVNMDTERILNVN